MGLELREGSAPALEEHDLLDSLPEVIVLVGRLRGPVVGVLVLVVVVVVIVVVVVVAVVVVAVAAVGVVLVVVVAVVVVVVIIGKSSY